MLRTIFLTSVFFFQLALLSAQTNNDQRTTTTRVADLLALMPAGNKDDLNKSMQYISALNENGLTELIYMLQSGGSSTTRAQYAIAGFSYYVTQSGNESKRQMAVKAYCNALQKLAGRWNQEFILKQLQTTGKDDAVPCLQTYLRNDSLAETAARALAQINSITAKKSLLNALKDANGTGKLSIVEALGYTRYKEALPASTLR